MSNIPRFLLLDIPLVGGSATLDAEQSSHCVRVLRLKSGVPIHLIDGKGTLATAEIEQPHSRETLVRITEHRTFDSKSKIHLVFGMTKPQSLDFIFKKCTEIGLASFQPLITDHSFHRDRFNPERWLKLVIEACKQSQEVFFPEIHSPKSFSDWIRTRKESSRLVICDEEKRARKTINWESPLEILIGPEGGWSATERNELEKTTSSQWLGLGKNRLRAETACLTALTIAKWNSGELRCGE